MEKDLSWQALEHTHTEKSSDWFWALGIVAFAVAVTAVLFGNILFALLIVVGSVSLGLLAKKEPGMIEIALTEKGVVVGPDFYPFELLNAFWIQEKSDDGTPLLLVDPKQLFLPHLVIPLPVEAIEPVRSYLDAYLPQKELREPFGRAVFELFGY